jgi:hypothetical protein
MVAAMLLLLARDPSVRGDVEPCPDQGHYEILCNDAKPLCVGASITYCNSISGGGSYFKGEWDENNSGRMTDHKTPSGPTLRICFKHYRCELKNGVCTTSTVFVGNAMKNAWIPVKCTADEIKERDKNPIVD